jgi:MoxR-like ATPase
MSPTETLAQIKAALQQVETTDPLADVLLRATLGGGGLLVEHVGRIPLRQPLEAISRLLGGPSPVSSFAAFRCQPGIRIIDFIETCTQPCPSGVANRRLLLPVVLLEDVGRIDRDIAIALESLLRGSEFNHGDWTVSLPPLSLVVGEQNRIDREAVNRLHSRHARHFGMLVILGIPEEEEELRLIQSMRRPFCEETAAAPLPTVLDLVGAVRQVRLPEELTRMAVHFARTLEADDRMAAGGSPSPWAIDRWLSHSQVNAFLEGRNEVGLRDLRAMMLCALGHRIRRQSRAIERVDRILGERFLAVAGNPEEAVGAPKAGFEGGEIPEMDLFTAFENVYRPMRDWLEMKVIGRGKDGSETTLNTLDLVLVTLFSGGHLLLEDYPGSGKSYLSKLLGEMIDDDRIEEPIDLVSYNRIQCTPDLLPSDVTGYMMLESGEMRFRRGPVFAYVLLVDEINRTTPKVQSALLQAMGEKEVTIDDQTYKLSELFFVIATQNPLDRVGTYMLPQAQLDRFLFKRLLPPMTDRAAISEIMRNGGGGGTSPKIPATSIIAASRAVLRGQKPGGGESVEIPAMIEEVILNLADGIGRRCEPNYGQREGERTEERLKEGSRPSVRTLQRLFPALKVLAWIEAAAEGRNPKVEISHLRKLCCDWLRHRILPVEPVDNRTIDQWILNSLDDAIEAAQH